MEREKQVLMALSKLRDDLQVKKGKGESKLVDWTNGKKMIRTGAT